MDARSFEDANAACSLLPGALLDPARDLLRLPGRRPAGGGGRRARLRRPGRGHGDRALGSLPLLLASRTGCAAPAPGRAPRWRRSRSAPGASWSGRATTTRWRVTGTGSAGSIYLLAGVAAAIAIGPYLVLVLVACGVLEMIRRRRPAETVGAWWPLPLAPRRPPGGLGALAWTAFKVGALSFGGGFVIIPLMQQDAVHVYHWMTDAQFLNAVALGQVTPGPVVATVAAVGYAAHGVGGAVLAAAVAFTPSFSFILLGGGRFERLRRNDRARAFLDGAGPGRDRRDPRLRRHPRRWHRRDLADPGAGRRRDQPPADPASAGWSRRWSAAGRRRGDRLGRWSIALGCD